MACIKVVYGNHIDLTWRRPRYVAGETEGWKITPYVELQEQQIDRALDFIRSHQDSFLPYIESSPLYVAPEPTPTARPQKPGPCSPQDSESPLFVLRPTLNRY